MWRRVARHVEEAEHERLRQFVEDAELQRLHDLAEDGQLGGEHDGEITRMEWARLAYWRWFWQQRPRRER